MNFAKLERALSSSLFRPAMCEIIPPPNAAQIQEISNRMPFALAGDHVELLSRYGGSILDEIRIEGALDIREIEKLISFANDYSGYRFAYNGSGEVFALDSDGGKMTRLSGSIDEFFNEFLLGTKGVEFYGQDWLSKLRSYGVV
jgi:hypothetical protein